MFPVQVVLQGLPGVDLQAAVGTRVAEQALEVTALDVIPYRRR